MNENTGQLCPTCKTGQETYLLDGKNPFCQYIHCHNGTSCTMYKPIEKLNKSTDSVKENS